ncbi:MAG: hypothetical protein ACTHLZ_01345 [Tepidisphaeraceae bacterium]
MTASPPHVPPPTRPTQRRGLALPPYVTIPLVLLVLMAGAWFVWSQLYGTKPVDLSQYESNDTPATRIRSRFFAQPATARSGAVGVIRREDGSGDVHIPGARARIMKAKNGWRLNLAYLNQQFIPAADRQAISARFVAMTDKDRAAGAGVTSAQIADLRKLKVVNEMAASDADRKALTDLWSKYAAAPDAERPAIEQQLTDKLRQVALGSMSATSAAAADYAKQIHQIIPPEQCQALMGNRPTTRPGKAR